MELVIIKKNATKKKIVCVMYKYIWSKNIPLFDIKPRGIPSCRYLKII